ncbi:MAG: hypothetical protein IT162_11250 [Bryobacterales bacterium]|nr:hypothetical protein [Bryobacterales bacterium]
MGLAERRMMQELKETTLPAREQEIAEICGQAIPYDVDWDSLANDGEALRFLDNVSCHRLNMALRVICMDAMGKEAVASSLKKVRLVNVKDKAAMNVEFAGGTLEMRCAYALGAEGMHSDGAIRQVLESGL